MESRGFQVAPLTVLDLEYGDVEHAAVLAAQSFIHSEPWANRALGEAEPAVAHVRERGTYRRPDVPLGVILAEQCLPPELPLRQRVAAPPREATAQEQRNPSRRSPSHASSSST